MVGLADNNNHDPGAGSPLLHGESHIRLSNESDNDDDGNYDADYENDPSEYPDGRNDDYYDEEFGEFEEHQPFTSKLEIIGWCIYSWAAEPFIVSVVGTYVPLLLEQIARDNGVKFSDKISPCNGAHNPTIPIPDPPSAPPDEMTSPSLNIMNMFAIRNNLDPSKPPPSPPHEGFDDNICVLPLLGGRIYIDSASYALYTFSISVLVQTIVVISMSGAADRGSHRKQLLIFFGIFGGISTMFYWNVKPDGYYMASILAIFANSAFGGVNVCGNSFLSVLVNNYEKLRNYYLPPNPTNEQIQQKLNLRGEISSRISGLGAALGYISALIVQIGTMLIILHIKNSTNTSGIGGGDPSISPPTTPPPPSPPHPGPQPSYIWPIKLVIGFVGLWWLIFQIPIMILLKSRPSPELKLKHTVKPELNNDDYLNFILRSIRYRIKLFFAYILHGYKTLYLAILAASQLKDICFFLLGWFIVSDSITTINSTAVLFARSELRMSTVELSQIGVLTMISAITGSIVIPNVIQPFYNLSIKNTFLFIIVWASIIPLYGVLGFFFNVIGLHHKIEMYLLAIWYGFSLGGLSTISRSLYSILIPKGQESVFFALFSITDKGSSILGPVLVGLIIDYTHDIRKCFWFLWFLLLLALPVLHYGVDLQRGIKEASVLQTVSNVEEDD